MNDYIFVVGAPGSRWSGVAKSIYHSSSVDRTDFSEKRIYHNPANQDIMHIGSYFDPGMEFGKQFDKFDKLDKDAIVSELNRPFSGKGKKIIKSHVLAEHLEKLHGLFDDPIVMVYRYDDHCFDWWHKAGGWDITYPNYVWYQDNIRMRQEIKAQNESILSFKSKHRLYSIKDNTQLCELLQLKKPKSYLRFTDCEVYCKIKS